jgi:hypothetical protein
MKNYVVEYSELVTTCGEEGCCVEYQEFWRVYLNGEYKGCFPSEEAMLDFLLTDNDISYQLQVPE